MLRIHTWLNAMETWLLPSSPLENRPSSPKSPELLFLQAKNPNDLKKPGRGLLSASFLIFCPAGRYIPSNRDIIGIYRDILKCRDILKISEIIAIN